MNTYSQIVGYIQDAADKHLAIKSFAEGPISYLDSNSQNIRYPFIFLRPLTSPGLSGNIRTLNFEMYSLDVPKLSNESPTLIKSNTELYIYDIMSYLRFNNTDTPYGVDFILGNIIPVNEAFNDRVYGWTANISVTEDAVYNYCNYPDGV